MSVSKYGRNEDLILTLPRNHLDLIPPILSYDGSLLKKDEESSPGEARYIIRSRRIGQTQCPVHGTKDQRKTSIKKKDQSQTFYSHKSPGPKEGERGGEEFSLTRGRPGQWSFRLTRSQPGPPSLQRHSSVRIPNTKDRDSSVRIPHTKESFCLIFEFWDNP